MSEIYQRFDSGAASPAQKAPPPVNRNASPQRLKPSQNGQNQHHSAAQGGQSRQHGTQPQNANQPHHNPQPKTNPQPHSQTQNSNSKQAHHASRKVDLSEGGINKILGKLLPTSVYNPSTKKLFGVLSAEDLLLVALIFLFLGSDDEDSSLLVLALAFVLLSDFIDLSSFAF